MVRRSFRLGLWVGLLFGIGFALYKTMQGRRAAQETVPPPSRDPWPPVSRVEPTVERPQPAPVPESAPPPAPEPPPAPPPPPAPEPDPEPVIIDADEEP